jgi:hypothetical protein
MGRRIREGFVYELLPAEAIDIGRVRSIRCLSEIVNGIYKEEVVSKSIRHGKAIFIKEVVTL